MFFKKVITDVINAKKQFSFAEKIIYLDEFLSIDVLQ